MSKAPAIETARLLLRPWRDADLDPWAAMNADARVMEFFPEAYSREKSDDSAARMRARLENDGFGWWIAETKDDGAFAGTLALQTIPFEAHFTPALEVGWRLPVAAWGKGLATEGGAALIAYAFEHLGYEELVSMTAALNLRSQRVMQRLGMTHDPQDDFEHPWLEAGHPLRPHVLYRLRKTAAPRS